MDYPKESKDAQNTATWFLLPAFVLMTYGGIMFCADIIKTIGNVFDYLAKLLAQ